MVGRTDPTHRWHESPPVENLTGLSLQKWQVVEASQKFYHPSMQARPSPWSKSQVGMHAPKWEAPVESPRGRGGR